MFVFILLSATDGPFSPCNPVLSSFTAASHWADCQLKSSLRTSDSTSLEATQNKANSRCLKMHLFCSVVYITNKLCLPTPRKNSLSTICFLLHLTMEKYLTSAIVLQKHFKKCMEHKQ